jgi:hypothetical protein
MKKKILDPYIVLDPAMNDLSSGGYLAKKFFLLFSVLFHKNEYIPRVLSFKIKFSSKIDPHYSAVFWASVVNLKDFFRIRIHNLFSIRIRILRLIF